MTPIEQLAWERLTADMAGGLHQFDFWSEVPEDVRGRYVDRALLELAAKAAGIGPLDFDYPNRNGHGLYMGPRLPMPQGVLMAANWTYWNPLNDDGDALRLAVNCQISFGIGYKTGKPRVAYHVVGEFRTIDIDSSGGTRTPPTDITADVRRAIVRAAAEIGARQPDSNPPGDTNV